MEKKLELVFDNVNNWLRFAEAKNAMLLGFNGVVFWGAVKLLPLKLSDFKTFNYYLLVMLVLLSFSCLVVLLSFVPNLKILRPSFNFKKNNDNYLYFDVLRSKTVDDIITKYNVEGEPVLDYHKHLAEQIITNANITKKKYDYFTLAIWISISAFVTLPISLIFFIYNYTKTK